jgi:hypothetical protein
MKRQLQWVLLALIVVASLLVGAGLERIRAESSTHRLPDYDNPNRFVVKKDAQLSADGDGQTYLVVDTVNKAEYLVVCTPKGVSVTMLMEDVGW